MCGTYGNRWGSRGNHQWEWLCHVSTTDVSFFEIMSGTHGIRRGSRRLEELYYISTVQRKFEMEATYDVRWVRGLVRLLGLGHGCWLLLQVNIVTPLLGWME
jgi:hypothetical protein